LLFEALFDLLFCLQQALIVRIQVRMPG